jgi:zinc protease
MTPTRNFALLASLLALAVAPLCGQKQAPPEGGPARAFTVPAHETYTLPDGVKVTLAPYGILPKVTLSVVIDAGGIDEGSDHVGVAGLTADLLQEGTEKLTSAQLADAAARMGGSLSISSSEDQTTADLDVLSDFGPDAARLLAEVVRSPRLPESELARVKNNMLRRIAVDTSRPGTIAQMRFSKILYGDHPYSIVEPSEDQVKKLTLDDVKSFVAANFGAQRTHIYVAGRFDSAAVRKAIAEGFGGWMKGPTARTANPPSVVPHRVLDLTDRPGAPQSTLIVGLPVIPPNRPDALPLRVTNALLGGSFNSRITSNIREQKGYTYSPFSAVSEHYHDAYWSEEADVTTQFTGPSIHEIVAEIKRLGSEPPSAGELKGIQNYLSGIFVIQNSNRGALIRQLEYVDFQGLGDDYLKNYVARVNAVTPDEVEKIAATYIKPDQLTIVIVGDKSKIGDQVAPYAADKPL